MKQNLLLKNFREMETPITFNLNLTPKQNHTTKKMNIKTYIQQKGRIKVKIILPIKSIY